MNRWLIWMALLLGNCTGCAAIEDAILGPEPGSWNAQQPTGGCQNPNINVNLPQTAEPDLLRK
jgi:hypothetical protein